MSQVDTSRGCMRGGGLRFHQFTHTNSTQTAGTGWLFPSHMRMSVEIEKVVYNKEVPRRFYVFAIGIPSDTHDNSWGVGLLEERK